LNFDLAGSQRGDINTVTVALGEAFAEEFTLGSSAPFQTITRTISVATPVVAALSFDHVGGDSSGLLLDRVRLARIGAPEADGADFDRDGFPNEVELELGSDPFDASSTPLTVTPAITEAVSTPFVVLNSTSASGSADRSLFIGEAMSPVFTLLNTTDSSASQDRSLFIGETTSTVFSVLNTTNSTRSSNASLFIGEVVSPVFTVLNTTNSTGSSNRSLFIGEVVSPVFTVLNTATSIGAPDSSALFYESVGQMFRLAQSVVAPFVGGGTDGRKVSFSK
jgi:hypothetical protein